MSPCGDFFTMIGTFLLYTGHYMPLARRVALDRILNIQKKLLPDLLKVMQKRYNILRHIQYLQPVGRRSLASSVDMTERVLRSETDFLRAQGLLDVDSSGMRLTEQGMQLLAEMEPLIKQWFGLSQLEKDLKDVLGIKEVIVVPGDADSSEWVKKEMGRAAAKVLKAIAKSEQIVAVSGGTTMLALAEMIMPSPTLKTLTFVPTRGGVGESVELEANYIASLMAKRTGGKYRLMHVPDQLSDEAYATLVKEPHIQEVISCLKKADIVIHGVGEAKTMAQRRKSTPEVLEKLEREKAVGESFGYYFNRFGEVVYRVKTVGLKLHDLDRVKRMIAIAGGTSKAEAILSICTKVSKDMLITDEGAARAILEQAREHLEHK